MTLLLKNRFSDFLKNPASILFPGNFGAMRGVALLVVAFSTALPLLWSCREEDKLETADISSAHRPTMTTHNVMTIISDSGIPQYRIVSPVWYVYDNLDTPIWILAKGPYLEKFDPQFNVAFTVSCDSAVNNRITSEWLLLGNVEYIQHPGTLIASQQLRWNQREGIVMSDSFIHLEQPGKVIEGYGFHGKISPHGGLTDYVLNKPMGVLPYVEPGDNPELPSGAVPGMSGIPSNIPSVSPGLPTTE